MQPHIILNATLNVTEVWLVFLPIILFVLFILILFYSFRNSEVSLSDLLAEKDIIIKQQSIEILHYKENINADHQGNDSVIPPSKSVSASRFIVLLTGFCSVTLSVCLSSFWMYKKIIGEEIKFEELTTLLITLGIGVVPYGLNRITSRVK